MAEDKNKQDDVRQQDDVKNDDKKTAQDDAPKKQDSTPRYPDDVDALLTKARNQERQKVAAKLESLEQTAKTAKLLEDKVGELESNNQKLKDKLEKLNDKKDTTKNNGLDMDDINKLVADAVDKTRKAFSEEIDGLKEQNKQLRLENYKKQAISKAGGNLIKDMVNGSTEDEIDASIIKAKSAYEQIASELGTQKNDTTQTKTDDGKAPPVAGAKNTDTSGGANHLREMAQKAVNMDDEDWQKQREKILADTASAYTNRFI